MDEIQTEAELETPQVEAEESHDETESQQPDRPETAQETVTRIASELASSGSKDQSQEEKPLDPEEKAGPVKVPDLDPELSPPERLNAAEKQLFNNLPKGLKRAFHKTVKGFESQFTRTQQELVPKLREYHAIDEVLAPHLHEWAELGVTKSQAIAQLVGIHAALKNPQTKVEKFKWLANNCGIDINQLVGGGSQQSAGDISAHPQVIALQNELASLRNQISPIVTTHASAQMEFERAQSDQATAEMAAVQQEMDAAGRYKYPNLHDADFLINKAKPLVTRLKETVPNLGWGEALKMAHDILTRGSPGTFSSTTAPSLQPKQTQSKPINLTASVRGRSAATSAGGAATEIPYIKGESAADTVRRMMDQLGKG